MEMEVCVTLNGSTQKLCESSGEGRIWLPKGPFDND